MRTPFSSLFPCALLLTPLGLHGANTITATLTANPAQYSGKCPAVIKFVGQITVTEACQLQYRFIRSDGAHTAFQTLDFPSAGSKSVQTTWTLGGPSLPSFSGWEAIDIKTPKAIQSNRAEFQVTCKDGR